MSFRKRNVALSSTRSANPSSQNEKFTTPGIKISPVTSNPTISTGTSSLDKLLSLGAGHALGTTLLIEEDGTTDFASALLRCYAAEGLTQGHRVIVVAPDGWANSLPGVVEDRDGGKEQGNAKDEKKMKIAWRYERLGAHGEDRRPTTLPQRTPKPSPTAPFQGPADQQPFCHSFDLTRRLQLPTGTTPPTHITPSPSPTGNPFTPIVTALTTSLSNHPSIPTRLIIPSLLSPLFYPPTASTPQLLLAFLHTLRSLTRQHPSNLTIISSYPLTLYPCSTILTRWTEHLSDGVLSLHPFPHSYSVDAAEHPSECGSGTGKGKDEENMQGLIKVIKLPILSERGVGVGVGEDMAFAVGRRRFVVRPFYLPPLEGEGPEREGGTKEKELEF